MQVLCLVAVGLLAGPRIRAVVLRHAVPPGEPPRLACPRCGHPVLPSGWRGLTAALPASGRCPACRDRIGPPPAAVEVAAGGLMAVLGLPTPGTLPLLASCWLVAAGLAVTVVDVTVRRLPDALTLPAFSGLLALLALTGGTGTSEALARAALAGPALAAGYLVVVLTSRGGLGAGDAKLALALGAALGWLGWASLLLATLLGFLLAAGYGLILILARRATGAALIPFGPCMLAGALAVLAALRA